MTAPSDPLAIVRQIRAELQAQRITIDALLAPATPLARPQLRVCGPCWDELCIACMGCGCACACRDEPRRTA